MKSKQSAGREAAASSVLVAGDNQGLHIAKLYLSLRLQGDQWHNQIAGSKLHILHPSEMCLCLKTRAPWPKKRSTFPKQDLSRLNEVVSLVSEMGETGFPFPSPRQVHNIEPPMSTKWKGLGCASNLSPFGNALNLQLPPASRSHSSPRPAAPRPLPWLKSRPCLTLIRRAAAQSMRRTLEAALASAPAALARSGRRKNPRVAKDHFWRESLGLSWGKIGGSS